ncbi:MULTISPECIES: response regulator [unclassified Oceanispirochaeta]|uniref:response regulator n=1 Tax=unclassified Oceanispirochaeta TaxID=2635722 RepID=UPI000E098CD7|nr:MULTISPECIES: response regulator [unclassified Oceanispirochaeta]MBF9016461.1 response regulator [Oceanispirochaeta sp. M2]NPD72923.1 response regulator [Oceanispirochaeta sp. M1]RDG31500.1 response regulator [Oceanispirochaeta sp. M1]
MSLSNKKRILIVDDTKLGRLSVRKILNELGIEQIEECSNGEETLELLKEKDFDLVLMDILMPGIGGIETLKQIKESGYKSKVLMVSADIQDATKKRCEDSGAAGFINKPVNEKKLKPVLEELSIL